MAEMTHTDITTRLQAWKEEFELLYVLAPFDTLAALEDCRQIHVSRMEMDRRARLEADRIW